MRELMTTTRVLLDNSYPRGVLWRAPLRRRRDGARGRNKTVTLVCRDRFHPPPPPLAPTERRPPNWAQFAIALALLPLTPSFAWARTPTPTPVPTNTDGPSPTSTTPTSPSPTPTGTRPMPYIRIVISLDVARSGQRVTLDGSANDPSGTYRWSQTRGDV